MSESASKRQRVTPRNSNAHEQAEVETPHNDLRQLAAVITPFQGRRATSVGPTPGSRQGRRTPTIAIRTPGTAARTPRGGPATRPIPARRAAPTTPHAIRALRERANAGRTPGHNRRRSGRAQRETPRDTLRQLSRLLAPTTRPLPASDPIEPQPTPSNPALEEDVEDGPDPIAPRLSMPLGDLDDDSFHEAPPRQSLLPDLPDDVDNGTLHSLEYGRRALSEDPRLMFSTRLSERFAELNELGIDAASEYEIDGTFINRRAAAELDPTMFGDDIDAAMDDTTTELRALTGRRDSRPSDLNLGVFGEDDETEEPTFRFTIPQRIQQPRREEQEVLDAGEGESNAFANASDHDDAVGHDMQIEGYESEGSLEIDLQAYREEPSAIDRSLLSPDAQETELLRARPGRKRKELRVSRYGLEYPAFPPATVKRLASAFARSQGSNAKLGKDTMTSIMQATDWFFEQIGEDLASYADHAGRKTIEDSDVITLMKRQRQVGSNTTPFSLAQKLLPRELLQELRMAPPMKLKATKGVKRKRMETVHEE